MWASGLHRAAPSTCGPRSPISGGPPGLPSCLGCGPTQVGHPPSLGQDQRIPIRGPCVSGVTSVREAVKTPCGSCARLPSGHSTVCQAARKIGLMLTVELVPAASSLCAAFYVAAVPGTQVVVVACFIKSINKYEYLFFLKK